MFKIAFPWAKAEEEKAERDYVKSKTETSVDETAGNLWIAPLLGTYIVLRLYEITAGTPFIPDHV